MNDHLLNQLLSVFTLPDVTGGAGHVYAPALQKRHSSVHVGLVPAAHHHMGSSLAKGLSCGQTDSEEDARLY